MILDFVINVLGALLLVALGGYILLFGRRKLWATLGIIGLMAAANLLAGLVAGADSGRDLFEMQDWTLLGIALAVGVLGLILGRVLPGLAAALIGFAAGADLALWLVDISSYLITSSAQLSDQIAIWVGVVIILIGGLAGLWFVRKFRDEALILIAMLLGAEMIAVGLGLNTNSSWTAIIGLSLALFSVVWQYADFLRDLKATSNDFADMTEVQIAESR